MMTAGETWLWCELRRSWEVWACVVWPAALGGRGHQEERQVFASVFSFCFCFVLFFNPAKDNWRYERGKKKHWNKQWFIKSVNKNGKFFTQSKENAMSRHIFLNIKKPRIVSNQVYPIGPNQHALIWNGRCVKCRVAKAQHKVMPNKTVYILHLCQK